MRSKPLKREVMREVGEVENGRKGCRNKDEKKEKGENKGKREKETREKSKGKGKCEGRGGRK